MSRSAFEISRTLEVTGLTKAQAAAIAEQIVETVQEENDQLVAKDFFRAEMTIFRAEMTGLEGRVGIKLAGLETKIAGLEAKIADSETRITKWLIALQLPAFFAFLSLLSGWIYFLLKK